MLKQLHTYACGLLLLFAIHAKSQLSGIYSIPATYTSIAAAISDLNTYGINGPVTFNIASGYSETAPAGGFVLNAIAGASATRPVIFQKSGSGSNPMLIAYTSGTNTAASAVQDGVWRFIGTDYVTINGIDISDPNTANPATMEFGYCFFKAGPTDGCQYNTITNCVITLNRLNNAAGAGPAVDGSKGIVLVNATASSNTTALTVTSAGGANSYNKFYANTLQNCNYGIALIGYADVTPFAYADFGNDIGGSGTATGNTIINYGGGGTTSPAAAVRTLAQYNLNVSNNLINNNNGSGVSHAAVLRGIYINTATSANVTINNNTLTLVNGGTTSQVSVIENASGSTAANNTVTISNNLVTNCTNSVTTSGTFYGIYNSGSPQHLQMSGNTFNNNTSGATSGSTYLIYNSGAVPGNINLSNNALSHAFNNASTAYSGSMYNIYNASSTTSSSLTVSGNSFSSYAFSNVIGSGSVYFIYNLSSCSVFSLSNNIWSGLAMNHSGSEYLMYNSSATQNLLSVTGNSIIGGYTRLAACGTMYCFYTSGSSLGTSSQVVTGNNFSNITGTVSGSGLFYGFYSADGSASPYPKKTVANNVLSNITYSTSGSMYGYYTSYVGDGVSGSGSQIYGNQFSSVASGGTIYGLYASTPTSPNYAPSVYQNTVNSISSLGASASIYATYLASGLPGLSFYKNKVYGISENGASGFAYGMYILGGTNANYYNNIIGSITTPSSSASSAVNGIYISSGTSLNLYYNTVFLNGSSSASGFGSNALYASTSASLVLKNNMFVNNSTATGTGINAAYRRSSTTVSTYLSASNNNLFYVGVPSATNVIYHDGTTAYQTLGSYKTAMAGPDANAVTENPAFASTSGAASNYLNLLTTTATQAESGGTPVSGITDDYNGNVRNATLPDIGSWEGSFLASTTDINAPQLTASGFSNGQCNASGRTFTASLSDAGGVASGTLSPRLYFKINSGSYASVAGSLSSGNANSGTWSFALSYSASVNDVISYFLVAQDASANLMTSAPAGFAGTDVNTVNTFPSTPGAYAISSNMSGTITVGATGTYSTLTAAANAYNNSCLSGPVTFFLLDASYSANETFPIVFQNNTFASASNSLLIRPAANVTAAITSTGTSVASLIKLLNARYVFIDGMNSGGSALSINNTGTSASANIWLASNNSVGVKSISIKNITLTGAGYTTSSLYGINSSADGSTPGTSASADNDNVTIQGNTFMNLYHGIYAVGTAASSTGGLDNWLINGNIMGAATVTANAIGGNGVYVSGAVNLSVTANSMRNFTTTAASIGAIYLASNINGISVNQNTLTGIYSSGTGGATTSNCGIYIGGNVINGTVANNMLTTIMNTNTGQWGVRGMIIATSNAASNLKVYNNMLNDISTLDCCGLTYSSVGIEVASSSGGIDIDFNTINLFGTHNSGASCTSANVYISSANSNIRVRNNILTNSYNTTGTSSDLIYNLYSAVANTNFTAVDNNNYYVSGAATGYLGYLGGVASNLGAMQSAFGQNVSSMNLPVAYTSITDAHLSASAAGNYLLDNVGIPVTGITTDVDGQSRSATTPDIGADEFASTASCSAANSGTVATTAYTVCNTQTVAITSASVSSGLNTAYQWQVSSTQGSGYANVSAGSGINTPAYKSSTLPAGIYYYVLKTTCNASLTSVSNEVTVTVNAVPNPVIVSSPSVICVSGSATLTATGASSFVWNTGATTPSIVITPSSSALYNVTGSSQGCANATSSNYNLFYSLNPTVNAAAANTVICAGTPATLTASGADTYSWSDGGSGANVNPTPSVSTTYTITGYKLNGCNSATTLSLAVNPMPTVNISGSSGICTGQTASLSAAGATSYSWNTGASTSSISTTPTASTVYTVTGSNSFGCSMTATQQVNVAASLSITIVGPSTICLGQPASLVGNGGVTYTWSTGSTSSTIAPTPTANATYSITGASGTCSNTAVKTITVNPNPVVSASGNTVICVGQTATLNAAGASTYTWSTSQSGASAAVSPTVNATYSVVGTSSLGCPASATIAVVSNSLPIIGIAQSSSVVCSLSPATFTASGASTYTWSTGSTGAGVSVTPTVNSTYSVSATNAAGCVSSTTVALATYSLPVITIAPASATICSLSNASLTASGASTYSWNTGAALPVISVNPASSTVYTVTGTTSSGCVSTKTVAVTTNSLPVMTIAPASATICSQSPVSFTASGAITYTWNTAATTASLNVYVASNTTYSVSGTNAQGCISTTTVAVTTLSLPVISVSPAMSTVCVNAPATFTATGAGTYTWNNSGSVTGVTTAITPTAASNSYSVTGKDASTGCISGASFFVFTNPLPNVSITASSATVCALSNVSFQANGGDTYVWSNGATTNSVTVAPATAGTYTVTGTVGLTGCSNSQTVSVSTNPLPVISIAPASPTVCAKSALALTASGAASYMWSNTSINAGINITPSVNVAYTVTGTDALGCTATQTVAVTVNALPVISVSPASPKICAGQSAVLTPSGAATYSWSTGETGTYTVTPDISGVYVYTVTGTDNNNCVNKTTVLLDVEACTGIKANSFSGNMVSVYPNPSNGVFTASFDFAGEKTVIIMNSVGQLIQQLSTSNTAEVIDLSGFAKGVYMVKVSSKEANGNYKIVIE